MHLTASCPSVYWFITCVINHITDEEKSQDLFVHKKETGEGGSFLTLWAAAA